LVFKLAKTEVKHVYGLLQTTKVHQMQRSHQPYDQDNVFWKADHPQRETEWQEYSGNAGEKEALYNRLIHITLTSHEVCISE